MTKALAVTERGRKVVVKNVDVITEGNFFLCAVPLPAISFITAMVMADMFFILLSFPLALAGLLGLLSLQGIHTKIYKKKIKRYFGMEEEPKVPLGSIQFFEKRNGKLAKIDSPQNAESENVYRVTTLAVEEIKVEHNPMTLWDKALKDVKSVYSPKGKKAISQAS